MTNFTHSWWGKTFLESLEGFADKARLQRGRTYARNGKILTFGIDETGTITAKVRGSINRYFGVTKEPRYNVIINFNPISDKDWDKIIHNMATQASIISRLLLNEIPENIEQKFERSGHHLLPQSFKDFHAQCSCPDSVCPCKHIAGVCYLFAAELDANPFLLFAMRGLSREKLQQALRKTPLGKALVAHMEEITSTPQPATHYYTQPELKPHSGALDLRTFWQGESTLPEIPTLPEACVPGILIKKQGDFPAFWNKNTSFIQTMDAVYDRVRNKHKVL